MTPLSPDEEKHLAVHVYTDRSYGGAIIGLVFSGPVRMSESEPSLKNAMAQQFSWTQVVDRNGNIIPHSLAVIMNIPAVFLPGQELVIPVKSKVDARVIQIGPVPK